MNKWGTVPVFVPAKMGLSPSQGAKLLSRTVGMQQIGHVVAGRHAIVIRGHHYDLVFRRNVIGNSKPGAAADTGILADASARGLSSENNRFLNVKFVVATLGRPAARSPAQ